MPNKVSESSPNLSPAIILKNKKPVESDSKPKKFWELFLIKKWNQGCKYNYYCSS